MKSSITKYVVGAVLVIAVVAYIIFANKGSAPAVTATSPNAGDAGTASGTASSTASGSGAGTQAGATTTTGGTALAGQYKDGTYAGSVVSAFYGNFQVVVTIQGGRITDVTFPQAPSGGNSSVVSAMALPALKQEAITAQSANVNTVSGATQDSSAFNQSLTVALAQAKN
jgi:uncharacterized protein with FMN-binding domain